MKLFYSDTFHLPLPDNHRFPMAKYTLLRERIADQLSDVCQLVIPPAATDEQLLLVHERQYLQAIITGKLTQLEQRRIGFPWSEKMVERSRRSTGASISAGLAALRDGIAVNLAGGTHHSFAGSGQGYCVFNDVCVAAKVLQSEGLAQRALVVDCDVHQGNGTSGISRGDPTLYSFSVHCEKNYPFKKTDGDLDIALPPATGDDYYLSQLKQGLDATFRSFSPDVVFYLAGADPFEGDRLGLLSLSKDGLRRRDELVINYCRDLEIPMALAMAGGYAPEIGDIVDIHFSTVRTALERLQTDRLGIC